MIVAGARQNGEGNTANDLQTSSPARQLFKNIGAHQPNEARTRKLPQQASQRIDGVACAERDLDRACDDESSVRDGARGRQTFAERRHSALRFQRIAGRNQQPYLIEPQTLPREIDDMAMTRMRGIERAAEQADAHAPPVAEPRDRIMPRRGVQGRTCPVPITR
jgi:hypothetical protein